LETRVIKRTETGWQAAAYVWKGKDAILAPQGKTISWLTKGGKHSWAVPSASACAACHVDAAGFALGLTTQQLQGVVDPNGHDQVDAWISKGLLKAPDNFKTAVQIRLVDPHDLAAPLSDRARSWLDVNCAMCHQPNGPGNASIDLRLSTPLAKMQILNKPPTQGDLDISGAQIVKPGSPDLSILLSRISVLDATRMPNVSSHVVDERGVDLISAWIKSLKEN
jgi:mono/diheme cytochrome c family protein